MDLALAFSYSSALPVRANDRVKLFCNTIPQRMR